MMGNRFIFGRYPLEMYPERRQNRMLNEGDYARRRMRPYGWGMDGFEYKQMFRKKRQSKQSHCTELRVAKKAVRQQVRRELREEGL